MVKEVSNYSVFSYFPTWLDNYSYDKIIFKNVTDVALFNGNLVSEMKVEIPSNYTIDSTHNFVKFVNKENKKAYISFLGQNALKNISNSEVGYESLADTINNFCSDYGFDGVDIDLEISYFNNNDICKKLCKTLYSRLQVKFNLTIPWSFNINLKDLIDNVDSINVMFYNYAKPAVKAEHNAPLSRIKSYIKELKLASPDFPKHKLRMGIPFFGYKYNFDVTTDPVLGNKPVSYSIPLYTFSQVYDDIGHGNWNYSEDMSTGYMAPLLTNIETHQLISYDNEKSIQIKCQYIKEEGLGGAMVYILGYDAVHDGAIDQPLLSTVGKELLGTETP